MIGEYMAGKLVAFIAIAVMIGMALGYAVTVAVPKGSSSENKVILSVPASQQADTGLTPSDFTIINPHAKVTGRVVTIEMFIEDEQSRYHFLVLPDAKYTNMLNDGNKLNLTGALMVEVRDDDMGIMPHLHIGQHLEIDGPHVTDLAYGWNEINPANYIAVI
jgi:hypothetical protein